MTFFFSKNNSTSQIAFAGGIIVLDWAELLNNACHKHLELTIRADAHNEIKEEIFFMRNFYSHRLDLNRYKIDFQKHLKSTCWINVEKPSRVCFSFNELENQHLELSVFVVK